MQKLGLKMSDHMELRYLRFGETNPSPLSTNTPVRLRSLTDIYDNTEEVVGGNEQENEVMMVVFEEPTCY